MSYTPSLLKEIADVISRDTTGRLQEIVETIRQEEDNCFPDFQSEEKKTIMGNIQRSFTPFMTKILEWLIT